MKIIYKNSGGIAERDKFVGMESCCNEMALAIMTEGQIRITSNALIYLVPSTYPITFCPFCGVEVLRRNSFEETN